MKCKNAFWLSLACGISLAYSPVLAQGAHQDALPPGGQHGAQHGAPLPPLPHLDSNQRAAPRTITGPYRLTYTLTDMDGTKKIGSQRYVVAADPDAPNSRISQQSRVHIRVGSPTGGEYDSYETGIGIFATLHQFSNGLQLSSDISQTTLVAASPDIHGQLLPPETRESKLSDTVLLTENKPVVIGRFDIPGSAHYLQIEVELTKIP